MDTLGEIQAQQREQVRVQRLGQVAKAFDYLTWYGERHGWPHEDVAQVADMLGLTGDTLDRVGEVPSYINSSRYGVGSTMPGAGRKTGGIRDDDGRKKGQTDAAKQKQAETRKTNKEERDKKLGKGK